jgi:glycerol-3-phosphate dehydrogenase subunit B
VAASVAALAGRLAEAGLPYAGAADGANLRLPSPAGAARPAYLAPTAQLPGRLDDPAPMLIVGFEGLRDFYPTVVAHHLSRQGQATRAAYLPASLLTERRDANTVQLANSLDEPSRLGVLAAALRRLAVPGERIGLPAILGLDGHMETWQALQQAVDAPIFEIPTLPPSVPGIRLQRALLRLLEPYRVPVQTNMSVQGFGTEGERIVWVETETSARPLRHRAHNFLLASGGLLGGGFESDPTGRVWETVFDLPLTVPQGRSHWFRGEFLDPRGHPVFQGGIAVDRSFAPLRAGAPAYANLWAAGSSLAHADPILERSREGIAIASASAAVKAILAQQHRPMPQFAASIS